ncbi:hypothetical protein BJX68DRAFT_76301 [Aspergillus pseudodeflectus]|uniref:SPIN90/Ldb17 leucine-rich domain-containing protein n=1 Tax=Aspergillus pseudodeflectus TaxID=176178 RepID=A0ABR4KFD5_9EURO
MELEVSVDNEQEFWTDIQDIVSAPCSSEDIIDNALRAYLSLTTQHKEQYLRSELEVSRCSFKLLSSAIFVAHTDYVRRQMIYALLQEDDPVTLQIITSFLLFDGRQHEVSLHMMNEEGVFPRLLELLHAQTINREDGEAGLHRLLMDLLYEMSRIQRIRIEDLVLVDDDFIRGLFDLIERLSYDVNDPYHYPVIRVLLVLNEQFMLSAHNPDDEQSPSNTLTNKVIKVLSVHGYSYKTFGENIILLINREAETSLQLLTLKLLYLIFTTPSTYEYFFTNDLHVLVDILIRNLLDLPEEAAALRHTYLRVLYPLLAHTQLRLPPHYKRDELNRMLSLLVRGQLTGDTEVDCERIRHFDEVDETTKRLVLRCASVEWLRDEAGPDRLLPLPQREDSLTSSIPTIDSALLSDTDIGTSVESSQTMYSTATRESSSEDLSPTTADLVESPVSISATPRKHNQIERLGMHFDPASSSSLSVHEIASQREKPGVITPSRHHGRPLTEAQTSPTKHKVKPLPPKTRRWRGRRATGDEENTTPVAGESIAEEDGISTGPDSPSPFPSTPILTSTEVIPVAERRDSAATTSTLVPSASPSQYNIIRRSVSNPPPAVPPPRRSAIHHNLSASSHCTPLTSPSRPPGIQGQGQKQPQKPEPPRTRRSGRKHTNTDSSDKSTGSHNSFSSLSSTNTTGTAATMLHLDYPYETPSAENTKDTKDTNGHATISVEEAVQNVSLH